MLKNKAVIFKNKYDVWQLRMYVKNARRYVEKSLRTKERALAEERAEDLYIEIRNDMKLGKSFFAITIKEGVALYLEYRKQDVGIADIGIVEGRYRTIATHTNHYLEYVNKGLFTVRRTATVDSLQQAVDLKAQFKSGIVVVQDLWVVVSNCVIEQEFGDDVTEKSGTMIKGIRHQCSESA